MSFEDFKKATNALASRTGSTPPEVFRSENGTFIARFSEGIVITGNIISKKVTVRAGNILSMATL